MLLLRSENDSLTMKPTALIRLFDEHPYLWVAFAGLIIWLIWPYVSRFVKAERMKKKESAKKFFGGAGCLFAVVGAMIVLVIFLTLLADK